MKKKIYCFDFDGTLTTSDTLLEFIRYAKGTGRFLMVFLMYSPLLVLMKLHLFPNWKAKQLIFAHLFAGMRIEKFDALCRDFAEEYQHLLRPKGVTLVHESLVAGAHVFIVSASIDNWVRPFFKVRGLDGVNLLILDEPTNHLDLKTKDVLKQALLDFDGTLIVVSHDRDFLDGLVSKVYEFGHGRVREHLCGIYEFLESKKMENLQELEKKQ